MATISKKKYQVVIVFSGVVAVGPPLPPGRKTDPTAAGPLFGVMPISGRRPVTYVGSDGKPVSDFSKVHVPVIFTKLKSSKRKPDDMFESFGIWYPIRERMQIVIDGDSAPGTLTYVHKPNFGQPGQLGDPETFKPSKDVPIEDFAAVPDMRTVSPNRCVLRPGALKPKAAGVAAQVFVPSGTLRAGAEDDRKFGRVVTYLPPLEKKPHVAVVVPQIRVTVEVDERLVIGTSSLDNGTPLDPISFSIKNDAEIWIANVDMDDVRKIIKKLNKPEKKSEGGAALRCDIDFSRYYDLTDGKDNVVLPCEKPNEAGERKCFGVTVSASPRRREGKRRSDGRN